MAEPGKCRVLVTIPNLAGGGAERMAMNLATALDRGKFDVCLFLHERYGPYVDQVPGHVDFACATDQPYARWRQPAVLRRLLRKARSSDVIVAANEGRATFLAFLAGRWLGKPVVGWIHNDWRPYQNQVSWRQRFALRQVYPRLNRVVCCSQAALDGLNEITGCDPQKTLVIPNFVFGADVAAGKDKPRPDWAEAILKQPTIVSVARLDPQKGLDVLIKAHALLRQRGGTQNLLILGEGALRGELEELADKQGVKDSTFLPGFVSNPYAVVSGATLFVLASRFEGFGLSLIEGMMCGVPVVTTDFTAAKEVLDNGKYGRTVPIDDVEALAAKIGETLASPALRDEWAAKAKAGSQRYSYESVCQAWENVLLRP
jgi:glycosyltransferase involved in cell wall biosynthesis